VHHSHNNLCSFISSSIRCAWQRVYNKYCRLFKRSAFVHHYECEGIEKTDLVEASENVLALIKDYEEVECD
jgi:tubulin alpha